MENTSTRVAGPAPDQPIAALFDVHGHAKALKLLLTLAKSMGCYTVSVTDIIDRGPDIIEAVRLATTEIDLLIPANHEIKLARRLAGHDVPMRRHGLRSTWDQIRGPEDLAVLEAYNARLLDSPLWVSFPGLLTSNIFSGVMRRRLHLCHAAYHPDQERAAPLLKDRLTDDLTPRDSAESYAIWGPEHRSSYDGKDIRVDDWTRSVPGDVVVLVGHEMRSATLPSISHARRLDGRWAGAVGFCDTGVDRGGLLSMLIFARRISDAPILAQCRDDGSGFTTQKFLI